MGRTASWSKWSWPSFETTMKQLSVVLGFNMKQLSVLFSFNMKQLSVVDGFIMKQVDGIVVASYHKLKQISEALVDSQ